MPIYFVTADGPQLIPEEIVSQGGAATEAFIAEQGWQPPPASPAAPALVAPASSESEVPAPAPSDAPVDEEG